MGFHYPSVSVTASPSKPSAPGEQSFHWPVLVYVQPCLPHTLGMAQLQVSVSVDTELQISRGGDTVQ